MLPKVILHNAVSLNGRVDWFIVDVGFFTNLYLFERRIF